MKILALVNAHALAHVSRPLEIAKVLKNRGHTISFAGYGKYLEIAAQDGFEIIPLPFTPIEQIVDAVRTQKLWRLYPEQQLANYIQDELALYERLQPDLLIIDNRLTASTSAEIARIKKVGIMNVHVSPYKRIPYYSIDNLIPFVPTSFVDFFDTLINRTECLFYDKFVMSGINHLRKTFGLKRKFAYALEEGDMTLLPDIPEFNPVSHLPSIAHYIGPLTWHNSLPPPQCLSRMDPSRKVIYFTLGSEGLDELLRHVNVFASQPVQIVVATGQILDKTGVRLPENVFIESFVNADLLLPHCDLVVCHGGNGTLYQALGYGLPIVGVATHEEQYYGLKRVNQLGLGIGLHMKTVKRKGVAFLIEVITHALAHPEFKSNAQRFQDLLRNWNGATKAADLIENFAAK